MAWAVVKGKYKQGMIKSLEKLPYRQGAEVQVFILFPENIEQQSENETWQQVKREIAREMPDLATMTSNEKQVEFARLSKQIANRMLYQSVAEFERAMRGDVYGLAGH